MINFEFDRYCYGCGNCENICPTNAISMRENREGFLVPQIDAKKCIQCGACDGSCIYLQKEQEGVAEETEKCYAMYGGRAREDVLRSASGGVFPALARAFLQEGGYVCGCVWNEQMEAAHVITKDAEVMEKMLHSKYTQSRIGMVYREIGELLNTEQKVLFCGTPCQVAALLRFTGNPPNLYTCDLICKGVPSPGVWKKYKAYLERDKGAGLKSVVLRSKHKYGWNGPVTRYEFDNGKVREDLFFQLNHYIVGFLDGLYMRPSCYACAYKDRNHKADMVLGDFWGIHRKAFIKSKNTGISAVIVRTPKGQELFGKIKGGFEILPVSYGEMVEKNPSMTDSTPPNPNRKAFFDAYETVPIEENIAKHTDLLGRKKKIIRFMYRTGLFGIFKWCKTKLYRG